MVTIFEVHFACLSTLNELSKWLNEEEQIIPIFGTTLMDSISSKKTYRHIVQEKDFGLNSFFKSVNYIISFTVTFSVIDLQHWNDH